ncbi:hypothetical protein DV735_g4933, partial [Chaetothyriales sp. CBS 134920]
MKFFEAGLGVAALLLLAPSALAHPKTARPPSTLPVVDLGYQVHQASDYDETSQLYNFSNIRFAQPPVGPLRWAEPQPPEGRNSTVTTGEIIEPICPQANPLWYIVAGGFLGALASGNASSFNLTAAQEAEYAALVSVLNTTVTTVTPDPRQREDCLFLDVIVPAKIFDTARAKKAWGPWGGEGARKVTGGAPVLVWIYGGGYVGGWKRAAGNPTGLINTSNNDFIFVAMNYRLGALGFMAGSKLKESGGVPNAAFYDQRLAIEWVAKYIHLFGGDKNQITIMGESAGGGSVLHQITAFGGQRPVQFQRAIAQSPAWEQQPVEIVPDSVATNYLKLLNVSTFAEARTLNSSAVILAQTLQIAASLYGRYHYGPAVDGPGGFAPKLPGQLLAEGNFAHNITVLSGHNANEAPFFTPPEAAVTDDVAPFVKLVFPFLPQKTVDYIAEEIYPPVYDGTYPWTDNLTRVETMISDSAFTCNNHYLNTAFGNKTWAYEFQVPPAFHGFDVPYTFWDGHSDYAAFSPEVAAVLQGYIVNFVKSGNPNSPSLPLFPQQGLNASMNGLNSSLIGPQTDPTVNPRCVYWQHAFD